MTIKSIPYQGFYPIQANGQYRLEHSGTSITAHWDALGVAPAGKLTFSVDGDPGEGTGVIDLGAAGGVGSRTLSSGGFTFAFLDIDVVGLSAGGSCILHIK